MIGAGQHILVTLYDDEKIAHEGVLPPGAELNAKFVGEPLRVTAIRLLRMTAAEIADLESLPPSGSTERKV